MRYLQPGETISILLASTDPRLERQIPAALDGQGVPHHLAVVWRLERVLERACALQPHVVLIDVGLGGYSVVPVIVTLADALPGTTVIALSPPTGAGVSHNALLAVGASRVLDLRFVGSAFARCLLEMFEPGATGAAETAQPAETLSGLLVEAPAHEADEGETGAGAMGEPLPAAAGRYIWRPRAIPATRHLTGGARHFGRRRRRGQWATHTNRVSAAVPWEDADATPGVLAAELTVIDAILPQVGGITEDAVTPEEPSALPVSPELEPVDAASAAPDLPVEAAEAAVGMPAGQEAETAGPVAPGMPLYQAPGVQVSAGPDWVTEAAETAEGMDAGQEFEPACPAAPAVLLDEAQDGEVTAGPDLPAPAGKTTESMTAGGEVEAAEAMAPAVALDEEPSVAPAAGPDLPAPAAESVEASAPAPAVAVPTAAGLLMEPVAQYSERGQPSTQDLAAAPAQAPAADGDEIVRAAARVAPPAEGGPTLSRPSSRLRPAVAVALLGLTALLLAGVWSLGRGLPALRTGTGGSPSPSFVALAPEIPSAQPATATLTKVPASATPAATQTPAAQPTPAPVAIVVAGTATATATAMPTATHTRTVPPASATPTPTSTASPTQTSTASPTKTATLRPAATRTPVARVAAPTVKVAASPTRAAIPRKTPTLTPVPLAPTSPAPVLFLSPPQPETPGNGSFQGGAVLFSWLPTGPLPAGAAYEVVWWNLEEAPAAARGIAPPTTGTSLTANLDVLYASHQLVNIRFTWTVLIVQQAPYRRLTQPTGSVQRTVTYDAAAH